MENVKDIKRLELTVALILVFTPLILKLLEDVAYRPSISNYAYSSINYVFVFLLTLAGSLFLWNSIGYKRHWYNSFLGVSLFGVALTPHLDFPVAHYAFAGCFFISSILSISLSSNVAFKNFKYIASFIIALALILHFAFNLFSLLVAEWLGIIPITLHFILKTFFTAYGKPTQLLK